MGWFGRKASVGSLKSDLKEASQLPLDQRERLASEMAEFIEEMKLVMKSPDHESTLMREYQAYGDFRKALAVGGFSANWAQHAFRESYLLALIKASDDPKWFSEVHALLHGIRGPLGLPPKDSSSGHSVRVKDLQDSLIETMRSGNTVSEAARKMGVEIPKEPPSDSKSAITTTPKAKTTASTTHSQRVAQMEDWMDQIEESRSNSESASAITTTPKANTTARTGVKQDSQHRGTVSCEECDGKISKRLSACPHCGCPVRKKVQCVDCDATFNADLKACPDCGGPV